MDMELCDKLIPLIPNGKIIVAESGVSNVELLKD
jgi:indole-3-glycerol phosphate synthase